MCSRCPNTTAPSLPGGAERTRRAGALAMAALLACAALLAAGCAREDRHFAVMPALAAPAGPGNSFSVAAISVSNLYPGHSYPPPPPSNPLAGNYAAVAQGRKLFNAYNCVGCHANGGGGMGPPLITQHWKFGSAPANLYATIAEGRPKGMPSWRGKIPEYQIWELVMYIRSLNGLLGRNQSIGRPNAMSGPPAPNMAPRQKPAGITGLHPQPYAPRP